MTTAGALPLPPSHFDLGRYDRNPDLTPAEQAVFRRWAASDDGFQISKHDVPRLRQPLLDVDARLAASAAKTGDDGTRYRSRHMLRFILMEVARRDRAYWGWNEQQWLDLVASPATPRWVNKPYLLGVAYLLGGVRRVHKARHRISLAVTARVVFGTQLFDGECDRLMGALERLGFCDATLRATMPTTLGALALDGGDPRLEAFDETLLRRVHDHHVRRIGSRMGQISHGLVALSILPRPLHLQEYASWQDRDTGDVHPEWVAWCRRWRETSTLSPSTRMTDHGFVLRTGLWLAREHPEVTGPGAWTAEVCADFLAAVSRLTFGEWEMPAFDRRTVPNRGEALAAQSKCSGIHAVRRFLHDAERWGWTRLRCNPRYHLSTPRPLRRLSRIKPRAIDDAAWIKLAWASLNLEASDCPNDGRYPPELLRAIAVVWTHAGLRRNEIYRLATGCARSQADDVVDEAGKTTPAGTLCYLDVPAGKNLAEYSKPVSAVVLERIRAWAAVRPEQPPVIDRVTGRRVDLLFQLRGSGHGGGFINTTVIPLLCAKAGIPMQDSMGAITSHRARASIVTALANAPRGMTLMELMKWCGHSSPESTMHYVRVTPTRLASAFAKADQMAHMISVLIDHDAVVSGAARDGAPYKYYDLGDTLCTNAFWSTCPHRLACAGCIFSLPKASAKAGALAARSSVTRMLEEVPLSPDERTAVEGDAEKLDGMLAKLADIPALDGRTPRQIAAGAADTRV